MHERIFVVRASHAIAIKNAISTLGLDADKLLAQVELEPSQLENPNNLILEQPVWHLFDVAAKELNIEHVGFLITKQLTIDSYGTFGQLLRQANNLKQALKIFIEQVNVHTNYLNYWLENRDGYLWVCRKGTPGIERGKWQVEQHIVSFIIELIRTYISKDWFPEFIEFQQTQIKGVEFATGLSKSNISKGNTYTAISIALDDLAIQTKYTVKETVNVHPLKKVPISFLSTLQTLLEQGYFNSNLTASHIASSLNIPDRKLQRILAQHKTTLNKLINAHKYHQAKALLTQGKYSNQEISSQLGYSNVNNFYRAFKIWHGASTKHFIANKS